MLWSRLRSFWRNAVHRSDMEREMADELQFHLEQRAEDLAARRGLSAEEARRMARIEFGSVEKYKEENRESLGLRILDDARADVRFALRSFSKSKGFTAAAMLVLALGIGANTAVFSVVDALLLRELPVKHPEELVFFDFVRGQADMIASYGGYGRQGPVPGTSVRTSFSFLTFERFRDHSTTLADVFAFARTGRVNVVADRQADTASALLVTGNYFTSLGVPALLGRTLMPSDDRIGAAPAVVISHRYWQRRFAGDPAVVGKSVEVDRVPATIVGVTPEGFHGIRISESTDVTLPVALVSRVGRLADHQPPPSDWWIEIMGRLQPGVTRAQAFAEIEPGFRDSVRESWALRTEANPPRSGPGVPQLRVQPGAQGPDGPRIDAQDILTPVFAVVIAVLVIGSVNLANLLLVRAASRRHEMSLRLTLGAGRARVIRQLLTEGLLLAAAGGAAGTVIAIWAKDFMRWFPGPEPIVDARIDVRVLAFTAAVSTITALAFAIGPALQATRGDLTPALKAGTRTASAVRGLASRILLTAQVAISLALLIGAGLFGRTLYNFDRVDLGFNAENLLVFRIRPTLQNAATTFDLYDRIVSAIDSVPGVSSTTHSAMPLIAGSEWSTDLRADRGGAAREAFIQGVRPNFLETLRIPLLAGRPLSGADDAGRHRVAVINRTMAQQFFGGSDPIGRRVEFVRGPDRDVIGVSAIPIEIVGIVGDAKYSRLNQDAPPTIYIPYRQVFPRDMTLEVRTAVDPMSLAPAIREAIRAVDPHLPVVEMKTQEDQIALSTSKPRAFLWLTAGASAIGLLLASLGLYGIVSYETSQRTNEIGIRMALGARRLDVMRLVMGQTMRIVAIGAVAGCGLTLVASRLIQTMLFNVAPTDPLAITAAGTTLLAVAFTAAYLPARRAARLDPTLALRYE